MIQFSALVAAAFVALASPAARQPSRTPSLMVPDWRHSTATGHASLNQVFAVDGLDIAIARLSSVPQFPDGTLPDTGAQIVAVEFWAHNPQTENADFFERFYPYAELSDGSNTDGEGVSFYPLTDSGELGQLTLKPNDSMHARFFLEIPANASIAQLVVFGPIDGAKTVVQVHASAHATSTPKP